MSFTGWAGGVGGTPGDGEYEPEKYGVLQIDNVDLNGLGLLTSRTDKACLGDLLNSKCFIGEAKSKLKSFCYQPLKHQHKPVSF